MILRQLGALAVLGAVSAFALLLLWKFVPGFSLSGSSGLLIYVIGGALVFLAFLKRHSSRASEAGQNPEDENASASESHQDIAEVRSRIREMKSRRSRSPQDKQD